MVSSERYRNKLHQFFPSVHQILLFAPGSSSGQFKRYALDQRNGHERTSNCEVSIPGGYESFFFMPVTDEALARKISKFVSDENESKKLSVKYFMEGNDSKYVNNEGGSNSILNVFW